jgi:hypothetical protein
VLLWAVALPAVAQEQGAGLVLRPERGLEPLARQVARMLERRTGFEVVVGGPPPPGLAEAVPRGHVGMAVRDGTLVIVLGGDHGISYATELDLPARATAAAARAVALAVESLRDASLDAPPPAVEGGSRPARRWVYSWRFVGDLFPERSIEPIARPTLYLRILVGVSPIHGTFLFGPGAGLGLCVTGHCMVLEGDLPLFPERRRTGDLTTRYRSVNFSVRFQYRPFEFGPFVPGITAGFMTRIGTATIEELDTSTVATNLGVRGTLELAYRFARRFELVLEAGLDVAISRAEFVRELSDEPLFLEDRYTPWGVLSTRLRP